MAELWLVRHGQASFGSDDYDRLSPLGEQQSRWLGEYLAERGIEFDALVTGTLRRHAQTAEGLCAGLGATPPAQVMAGFDEFDFDALLRAYRATPHHDAPSTGDKARDFYRRLKHALQLWARGELPGPLPETWPAFVGRVGAALDAVQRSGARRVLVVSSGGAIAAALQRVLDAPDHTLIELNLQIRNTSLSQVFFNADALRLQSFNALPHLDRPDRAHAITYA